MKRVLWAPGMLLGLLFLSACGEESPIVDAPLPPESSKSSPAETLHLDYAWGTALLSEIEGAGSGADGGELRVRVQTPGRRSETTSAVPPYVDRTFAVSRIENPDGAGVSFQIRDESGRIRYELGARSTSDGGVLFERSGSERLDVFCSELPDGRRRERYRFESGASSYDATWVEGAERDTRFDVLGRAAAGLAESDDARLLTSLLSDARFAEWLSASASTVRTVQTQYIPLEFELACDLIDACRREICEDHPGHPLCIGCTAGSMICSILRILWP